MLVHGTGLGAVAGGVEARVAVPPQLCKGGALACAAPGARVGSEVVETMMPCHSCEKWKRSWRVV
jgi:hypothetical protein